MPNIPLPAELASLAVAANSVPWQQSRTQSQLKFNQLLDKYREYDRFHNMACELEQRLPVQPSLNESGVNRASDTLKIDNLEPLQALKKLGQLAQHALDKGNQPTLEAIRRQVVALKLKALPDDFKPALTRIATELVSGIVISGHQWLKQLQTETENQLHSLEAAREKVEAYRSDAEVKYSRAIALLQEFSLSPHLPDELLAVVKRCFGNPSNLLAQTSQFSAKVRDWKSRTEKVKALIATLEPFTVLSIIKDLLIIRLYKLQEVTEIADRQLQDSHRQLQEIEVQLQQQKLSENLISERSWWQTAWEAFPRQLQGITPPPNPLPVDEEEAGGWGAHNNSIFELEFLRKMQEQFDSWQQQLAEEEAYLNRYQKFVQDWISKLRHPSEQDGNELRRVYLDNANVVGITCVQAANREFSEEFKYFDVVIIDEVSKCTPPELLIPALKGKKLVMVGDHRQLPPMLDSDTLADVAEEIGTRKEELHFLEESLFKSQFEAAHASIKQMLTTQYRMHPSIMGAINQFYDHKLDCGIVEPDVKRAHGLAGKVIEDNHHLIWVKMPADKEFEEQREGTSLFNIREVDVIESLCQQLESVWAKRVAKGEPKKEISVITFYIAQLRKIDDRLQSALYPSLNIRTGTVDRFQGMERPIVIVSMVRNNSKGDVGFAKKPERVNVAFSRAQELLVIVGCHDLFTNQAGKAGSMYSEVANVVRLHGGFVDVSRILC